MTPRKIKVARRQRVAKRLLDSGVVKTPLASSASFFERQALVEAVEELIRRALSERQAQFCRLHFLQELSLVDTAKEMGINRTRAWALRKRVLEKLGQPRYRNLLPILMA